MIMLKKGCEVARASLPLRLWMKCAVHEINYFEDAALIEEQAKRFSEQ